MKTIHNGKEIEIEDVRKRKEDSGKSIDPIKCALCGATGVTLYNREDNWLCKPCLTKFEVALKVFNGIVNEEEV